VIPAVVVELVKLRRSTTFRVATAIMAVGPIMVALLLSTARVSLTADSGLDAALMEQFLNPDWDFYLLLNAQMITGGMGHLLFALMAAFIFVREYAEKTYPDLLMQPVPRGRIVLAKFATLFLWMTGLALLQSVLTLGFSPIVGLGVPTAAHVADAVVVPLVTTWLFFLTMPVLSFLGTLGRGYLAPMTLAAAALLGSSAVATSELIVLLPWSIPGLYVLNGSLTLLALGIAAGTAIVGVAATVIRYRTADALE
jgi:ABC-type transport system involved in multi-copper enzyme maturation permease subunit